MTACWPLELPLVAKAVLISMADNANDEGHCWPSLEKICERTCASRRAVIDAIKALESYGVLTANRENGRHTTYQVSPANYKKPVDKSADSVENQCGTRTSAPDAPVQEKHKPVRQMHGRGAPDARDPCAKRTLTVIEPSMNHQEPKEEAPDGVSAQVWSDFKAMRAKQKAPITKTSLDGIRREADKAGMSLEEVLRECCERSWRGFKAAWMEKQGKSAAKPVETFYEREQRLKRARFYENAGIPDPAAIPDLVEVKNEFPQLA